MFKFFQSTVETKRNVRETRIKIKSKKILCQVPPREANFKKKVMLTHDKVENTIKVKF